MSAPRPTTRSIAHLTSGLLAFGFFLGLIACGPPAWAGGIHAVLGFSSRGLRVVELPAESPARRAGLREGDAIIAIDGRPVSGLSGKQIHDLLSGEVGSSVSLTVIRDDAEQKLSVPRAPYAAPNKKS
jgi:S1-C subfamily serine protease